MTIKEFRKLIRGTSEDAELLFRYGGCLFRVDNIIEQNESPDGTTVKRVVVVPLAYVREADDE